MADRPGAHEARQVIGVGAVDRRRTSEMKYLTEHVSEVLDAIRHSSDLLRRGGSWETTAWVRSMADAAKLAQRLQDAVLKETDQTGTATEVCVGIVRRQADDAEATYRWGVLVKLGMP